MIGMQKLTSLQRCVETVPADDIPGDLIECGGLAPRCAWYWQPMGMDATRVASKFLMNA
jgi:hypothetical protein